MTTMTGAKALVKILEEEGVKVVFGYPGGAILPVYSELQKSKIKHVLTRTEQGATHAANGYARATGTVGVCISTSGPGATNLVTGIATAYMDSIPLVAISGQVATSMVGTDAFQEVDITGITQPITKHNFLVTNPDDIPRVVKEAFHIARTGRPGPVLIDLPKNVAEALCHGKFISEVNLPGYKPTYKGNSKQIKEAVKLLKEGKRPLFYIGGGVAVSGAKQLGDLAHKLQIPVVNTLMGKGAFPAEDSLALGMLGLHGMPAANYAVSKCDVLFGIGVRFDDRVTITLDKFAPNAKIIHLDIDPAEIGKNVRRVDVPIVGDVATVLDTILEQVTPMEHKAWLSEVEAFKAANNKAYPAEAGYDLVSRQVVEKLSELTGGKIILTTDVGQHQMTAAQFYQANRLGGFISSGGLGTMGYGLPAALGAQMACPDDTVVCITGDGSLQMSINELATIKGQNLPVKVILFNNNCLALVRQLQHHFCNNEFFGVDFDGNPDFCMLAKAYGFEAYRVTKQEEIESTLKEALANGKPTLIECLTNKADMVYPIVLGGKGLDEMLIQADDK